MTKLKDMGMGPLANPKSVFVRKFRWTLEGKDFDDKVTLSQHWFKTVDVDFSRSQLNFQVYEIIIEGTEDLEIQAWLDKETHDTESLTLTTYDGCGKPLYAYNFFAPVVVGDVMSFDYASSEESLRNVSVKFEDYTRVFLAGEDAKIKGPFKKRYLWKLRMKEGPAINVKLTHGSPQLSIEEADINYMNAKIWIPGKATWQSLHMVLPANHHDSGICKSLLEYETGLDLYLDLYTMDGSTLLETWVLKDAWAQSIKGGEDTRPRINLRFGAVEYTNAKIDLAKETNNE
jgi:hypothetical protein